MANEDWKAGVVAAANLARGLYQFRHPTDPEVGEDLRDLILDALIPRIKPEDDATPEPKEDGR